MTMTIEQAAASLDPPEFPLPEGAFGCHLCKKTFGYQIKLASNLVELHFQAHVARFFKYLFDDEQIRGSFYRYCETERNFSTFIKL